MIGISKTKYCKGVQCPKMLWLKNNRPELEEQVTNQRVFENGNLVGDLAMSMFGDYTEVTYSNDYSEMIAETNRLVETGTEYICEASFGTEDGLFCSIDIMRNLGNNHADIYEVKSSTRIKDEYYDDVAFQVYVMTRLGYAVEHTYLVHLDNTYVLDGELDLQKLFKINDITDHVMNMQEQVKRNVEYLQKYLEQTEEPEQKLNIGCFSPYSCNFWNYCTRDLPKHNVFQLSGMHKDKMIEYYLADMVDFEDLRMSEKITPAHKLQIDTELSGKAYVDSKSVVAFMDNIRYPLYFLDFESFQPPVPIFQGTVAFQQIVFQYSLHIIRNEGQKAEDAEHIEFIAEPGEDPRRAVAESLCRNIPADVCVTAYYKSFEKTCIKRMANYFPDLHDHLMAIHDNIVDIEDPFSKHWIYYPGFNGSASIKVVLPSLFPNDSKLDYQSLEGVHKGDEASDVYLKMADMPAEERAYWKECLLRYCELDTFAMVKIWERLKELAARGLEH